MLNTVTLQCSMYMRIAYFEQAISQEMHSIKLGYKQLLIAIKVFTAVSQIHLIQILLSELLLSGTSGCDPSPSSALGFPLPITLVHRGKVGESWCVYYVWPVWYLCISIGMLM